ncbi:MAG: hypothetical protein CL916_09095 [Deltaproteobacteria bacterium]|nr:hypothetical protein [Deltaproteobacteria bacterium]
MTQNEDRVHDYWTDVDRVKNFAGDFSLSRFLIVMLSLEYTKSDATVVVSHSEQRAAVIFQKGKIVDFYGFGNLISTIVESIPKGSRFGDVVGLAMAQGARHDEVMPMLQKNIALSWLSLSMSRITVLSFEKPKIPMKLGVGVIKLISMGLEDEFLVHSPKRKYRTEQESSVFAHLPDGLVLTKIGLPPAGLRMIRSVSSETILRTLVQSKTDWQIFHLLHLFGLLDIEPTEKSQSTSLTDGATEDEKKCAELQDWLNKSADKEPHDLLDITQANELNSITISKKSRDVSSKVHPDRFVAYGPKVQELAQRCFELVSAAEDKLSNEEYLQELKARLDAESRGEVYVSESAEKKSHLLYEKAKFLFRRNKIQETQDLVEQAYTLNPYYWRLNYLRLQLMHKQNSMPDLDIAEKIMKIEGCKGHERMDILCFAAELYYASEVKENKDKCKEILKTIRTMDPEFQRAKILFRRIKRDEEKPPEEKKEKKGFFSSLFKR